MLALLALGTVVDASSNSNPSLMPTSSLSNGNVETKIDAESNGSERIHPTDNTTTTDSSIKKPKAANKNIEINRESCGEKKKSTSKKTNGASKRPSLGGSSTSLRRIKKEYKDAVEMGIAYDWVNQRHIQRKTKRKPKKNDAIICLGPITTNLREWHFSFRGVGEVYSKGIYHGQIILPKDYPLSPPSIQMWTPNGRFKPFKDICLSATNYHPESWTPRWSIHALVTSLRLHMLNQPNEIGGMVSDLEDKEEFARKSLRWLCTWRGSKKTKITVNHVLLLREGVLSLEETNEGIDEENDQEEDGETNEETDENNQEDDDDEELLEENSSVESSEIPLSDLDSDIDSNTDSNQEITIEANIDTAISEDTIMTFVTITKKGKKKKKSRIKEAKSDTTISKDKTTSVAKMADSKGDSRTISSGRFGFRISGEALSSIFQLAILYLVVIFFLKR